MVALGPQPWTSRRQGRRRKWGLVLIMLLLSAMLAGLPTPFAQAASAECGTFTQKQTGFGFDPTSTFVNRAYANIERRSAPLCYQGFTNQPNLGWWVMIFGNQPDGQGGWMQVGYIRESGYTSYSTQWVNQKTGHGSDPGESFGYPAMGSVHLFDVLRENLGSQCASSSGYCLDALVDGQRCWTTLDGENFCMQSDFDPHNAWTGGTIAGFFGESPYPGSDMPGTPTDKTNFTSVTEKDGSTYVNTLNQTYASCPWWTATNPTSDQIRLWTPDPTHGHDLSAC